MGKSIVLIDLDIKRWSILGVTQKTEQYFNLFTKQAVQFKKIQVLMQYYILLFNLSEQEGNKSVLVATFRWGHLVLVGTLR